MNYIITSVVPYQNLGRCNTLRISVQSSIRTCILHTFSSHQTHISDFKYIHTIPSVLICVACINVIYTYFVLYSDTLHNKFMQTNILVLVH